MGDDGRHTAVTITDIGDDGFHDQLVDLIEDCYDCDDVIIER